MQKILIGLLIAVIGATLAGCAGNAGDSTAKIKETVIGTWVNGNEAIMFIGGNRFVRVGSNDETTPYESGTYTLANDTGIFTPTYKIDNSASNGFSSASDVIILGTSNSTLTVSGISTSQTFSKVLRDSSKPVVGTWMADSESSFVVLSLTSDGHFYFVHNVNADGNMPLYTTSLDSTYEYGTYSIDPNTNVATITHLSGRTTAFSNTTGEVLQVNSNDALVDSENEFHRLSGE